MDEARLEGIPLFAGLGKSERRLVARCADEVELEPGDSLCREGELAWEFLVIEEGSAKVVRGDQFLNELGPGDFLGEIGVIEGTARNATVTALSPIRAIVMTGHAFRQDLPRDAPGGQAHPRRDRGAPPLAGARVLTSGFRNNDRRPPEGGRRVGLGCRWRARPWRAAPHPRA